MEKTQHEVFSVCIKQQDTSEGCRGEPPGKNSFHSQKWKETSLTPCQCSAPFPTALGFLCEFFVWLRMLWAGLVMRRQERCSPAGMQLSLRSKFLLAKACTSQAPSWRKGVALRASHALAAPHPRAQAGPAMEWSQKASGHLPAPRNHFLASFHLQQVPIVHSPDKNRCLTVFLARLTPDHTINTSRSERAGLDWNQQQHKVPYRAHGLKRSRAGTVCSAALWNSTSHHHSTSPTIPSQCKPRGTASPWFLVGFSFTAKQEPLWK